MWFMVEDCRSFYVYGIVQADSEKKAVKKLELKTEKYSDERPQYYSKKGTPISLAEVKEISSIDDS